MDTKFCYANFIRAMCIMVFLAALLSNTELVLAANNSPFVGHWQATDPIDGSEVQLIIAGPPNGPFNITQTDSYISFCDGGSGIIRGEGWINEFDSYMLEADLHIECFTTGAALDFHWVWLYHPSTNTLTNMWNGKVFIWSKSGPPQSPPQLLGLRVNYGEGGWVESFYEAGHTIWITVTKSDGVTVKATAQVYTEPRTEWDGDEGFQTTFEDWDPEEPDIQPFDWVYGWVDNGAAALVQIGEISGTIDLEGDSIEGTVYAPWFENEVEVECHSWGMPGDEILEYDMVFPNGEDSYSCSWAGEWQIHAGEVVGVGYFGPDGHWVANVFYNNARIVASESGDWFWVTDFAPWTTLTISIYSSDNLSEADELYSGTMDTDESGFALLGYDDHLVDMMPGNYLVVSDGITTKDLVLEPIAVTVFDPEADIMAGTAPAGRLVLVAAGLEEYQEGIWVLSDPSAEEWVADFSTTFDFTEEMRGWSYAQIFDDAGDANEGSTPPENTWRDEFYGGSIAVSWSWVSENPDMWNLTEQPGFLRLYTSSGPVGDQNLLLRPPADRNFIIETRLLFEPDTNFQFAGLMIFEDKDNFLAVGRAFCDREVFCVGNGLYFDHIQGSGFVGSNFATQVESSSEVFLRLERVNDMITGLYSLDGQAWFEIGTHWLPYGFQINGVGLSAHGDTDNQDPYIPADFDYFEMTDTEEWWSSDARMTASITEDWFYLLDFAPYKTFVFDVYETQGGDWLSGGYGTTDGTGFAWINADGRWDFEPGTYLVVSDGISTKDLVVEGFTFDVFDTSTGILQGTVPGQEGRLVWAGIGFGDSDWSVEVFTDADGNWSAEYGAPTPNFQWVFAQIFDGDGDATELRPASQIIFLRPACGSEYTVQAGSLLEIRYGSWAAIGEELANQNAEHLTVDLLLDGVTVIGTQQPIIPLSEIPCTPPREDIYGVYYVAQVGPLNQGVYVAEVTWILDEEVYDGDGYYGPGSLGPSVFTLIVP